MIDRSVLTICTFTVRTDLDAREVTGGDSVIASVPDGLFIGGDVDIRAAGVLLRQLAEHSARLVGEPLHHAEFVITNDPAEIESRGNMHPGCGDCGAGVRAALRVVKTDPTLFLIVGQCFWAATE